MSQKRFLVKDNSGRGVATTLTLPQVLDNWDASYKNNPDDEWEDTLGEWLDSADVGDTFTHAENNATLTRTK